MGYFVHSALLALLATGRAARSGITRHVVRAKPPKLNTSDVEGDQNFAGTYECPWNGEAYSAAFLCSRDVMLKFRVPEERLHRGVGNMEGASIFMYRRRTLLKTVDLFDFFVEHLSWYERRLGPAATALRERTLRRVEAQRHHVGGGAASGAPHARGVSTGASRHEGARRDVIAIMPFFATAGGHRDSGHSAFRSRRAFLRLTVESLRSTFPRYAVCVANQGDRDFATTSGLGFYDVLTYYNLTRPSRLGFATIFTAQRALLHDSRWASFKYFFYTESDQILHVRGIDRLLRITDAVPSHLLPHRVMPAPRRVDMGPGALVFGEAAPDADARRHADVRARETPDLARAFALREFASNAAKPVHRVADAAVSSCCFDRGKCTSNRQHWKRRGDRAVEFFQIAGSSGENETPADSFALVAGEGSFKQQRFRVCRFHALRSRCGADESPPTPSAGVA